MLAKEALYVSSMRVYFLIKNNKYIWSLKARTHAAASRSQMREA
jgi:hypothetical protein